MSEEGVRARFFKQKVVLGFASQQKGEEVTEDRDFVEIVVIGMDKQIVTTEAKQQHKERFPEEWAAYRRGESPSLNGTPIEDWPLIPEAQLKSLRVLNIYTVEDVAGLTDAGIQKVGMGGYKLRDAAKKFVQLQGGDKAAVDALKKANQDLQDQMRVMQEQIALMTRPPEVKKRGRPPKTQ